MSLTPIAIIMPIYEEKDSILDVFESIQRTCSNLVTVYCVLDSGNDSTIPVIESVRSRFSFEVHILINSQSSGPMEAIKFGIRNSFEDFLVIMTADNTDDCEDVVTFYEIFQSTNAGYISASRYLEGGSYTGGSKFKRKISLSANNFLVCLKGPNYSDPTNGFKGISRKFISSIDVESTKGFTYGLEFLFKAIKGGFVVESFPTNWHDRTTGVSKFKIVKWFPAYAYWFFRTILGR